MANNRKAINVKGGGILYARELSPTSSDTYVRIGYLKQSDLDDLHTIVAEVDEAGNLPDANSGSQVVKFNTQLMQTSKTEIDFVRNAKDKYLELYYQVRQASGKYQEYSFPVTKLDPSVKLPFAAATQRLLPATFYCLAPAGAFTRSVASFNVTENVPYVVVEGNSAAFNLSNAEAANLATAIL